MTPRSQVSAPQEEMKKDEWLGGEYCGGIVDLCLVNDFFVSFGRGGGGELLPLDEANSDAVNLVVSRYTSHLTPHTSHLTPHTQHLTPHTQHLTRHTSR
jgi:hypothetical protein